MREWEKYVREVKPYVAGEQPKEKDKIKLNTNENPYPPAPGVEAALKNMDYSAFTLYPDMEAESLVNELSSFYHINSNQIFVGVGSDDVLSMAFLTFFNSPKPILFPDITYSFYPVWAKVYQINYETPKLDEQFNIRVSDYLRENGGIVIANPNAPTSIAMPLSSIEEIVKNNQDSVVIIDEAYIDFGGETALPLIDRYENLLVIRTFSKSRSMAGMRIGYAMGNPKLISAIHDIKESINSYTMNTPSIILGTQAVKDSEYFYAMLDKVITTRERIKLELEQIGFICMPSSTNFLFASHKEISAKQIFDELVKNRIFVRYFATPRIDNFLRISIGTDQQMDKMMAVLKEILKK